MPPLFLRNIPMLNKLIEKITPLQEQLYNHSIYQRIHSKKDLQLFMESHVFAVWDFMSLVKFLQNHFAPSGHPWFPSKNHDIIHFINDIVLEEESDKTPDGRYMSHFEMYIEAMKEVGASTSIVADFLERFTLNKEGKILNMINIPHYLKQNLIQTFKFIDTTKPHVAASAFCFGRENIIPNMFQQLLNKMQIKESDAPIFHHYLSRHIQLDGEVHGPMAIKMVEVLCENDSQKWREATQTAIVAIEARIKLWDGILNAITQN